MRPREEAGTVLVKGDEDLECPLPLDPHIQELLGREEPSLAAAEVGDSLPPPPTSMPEDPEHSPLCQSDWIVWHARHEEMPPWWREPLKIPGHDNYQEFTQKVCASFEVLKACNWAKRVDNDHTPCQCTLQWGSTVSCPLPTQGLALRTTGSPNHTILLPT